MKPHRMRRACGAILVALAVALSACGGGSSDKDTYKKDAQAILNPVKTTFNSLGDKINGAGSQTQKIAEIDGARKQLDDAVNKLDGLDPPSDIKTEHDNFVTSLRSLATDFGTIEDAAKTNNKTQAQAAAAKIQADAPKVQQASDALEAKLK